MKENKAHISTAFSGGKIYLPLYDFFIALKQNNFLVTPKQITDSNSLIAQYSSVVKNEQELCNYLSPIFANSQEEQVQFKKIFEEYFKETNEVPYPPQYRWKKMQRHFKRQWWKYALGVMLGIAALVWFLHTPTLRPRPLISIAIITDTNGAAKVFLQINGQLPDSFKDIKLKATYHWGDNTASDTLAEHTYSALGNYTITAYVVVEYKKYFQYIDTVNTVAAICFNENAVEITPSLNGDTVEVNTGIKLQAKLKNTVADSLLLWTKFENDTTVKFRQDKNTATYTFSKEGQQIIYCTVVSGNVNSSCTVKDSVSFFVYDPGPKPAVLFSVPAGAKAVQPKYKVRSYWFYLLAGLTVLSLFFTSFFALRRNRSKKNKEECDNEIKKEYQNLIQSFSGKAGKANIPFQNKNYLPLPQEEIDEVARQMRKRINDDATFLHLQKTIAKAVNNAGFFDPVHAYRMQQSEYLVLIDDNHSNSQQVKLFEYLLELLAKQNVFIEKYYYRREPEICYSNTQPSGISIEKLSEKYPKHILLIFGNAYQLIYQLYPVIDSRYLQIINRWQYKAVLTPVSFLDWGNKEKKVLPEELPVLPVDIPGQLLLMHKLFGEEINIIADLKQYSNSFYETAMVDFEDVDELNEYCKNAAWANIPGGGEYSNILFQWIAALAVYPKIQWELTLAIGKAVMDKYGKGNEMNFTALLRIARIKWMTDGQFPDYTRLDMLKKLSKENEVIARETILTVLNEIPETDLSKDHFAYEEKETQRLINEFNLYAYDPVKYAGYKKSKDLIAQMWRNRQVTDAPAQIYIDNKDLQWDTLINKPAAPGEVILNAENISADDYFESGLPATGLLAKFYLWAAAVCAVLFFASLIGLIGLAVLNYSNTKKFSAFTYKQVANRSININYADSTAAEKVSAVVLSIGTAQTLLQNKQPSILLLPVDDSVKKVLVTADDVIIFDTLIRVNYDAYNITLTNNTTTPPADKTTVTLQLTEGCSSNLKNYTAIINEADSNFIAGSSIINENSATQNKVCLNSIVAGKNVNAQRLNNLIKAFNSAGISLKPGVKSKYFAAENEIVIYQYDSILANPVVVIQVSDNSLAKTAAAFKNDLAVRGFTVRPVSIQNYNYNSEISYYDASMQNDANTVKKYYNIYYPQLKVQARLRKAPDAGNYKNIIAVWIKKLDDVPAVFDISNIKFTATVTSRQKFSVAFDIVNTSKGKAATGKTTGRICILSEQTCNDFTFNAAGISSTINQQIDISKKLAGRHEVRVTIDALKINKSLGYFTITADRTALICDTVRGYAGSGNGSVLYKGRRYNKVSGNKNNISFRLIEKNNQYAVIEIGKEKCPVQKVTFYINKPQNLSFCDGSKVNFNLLDWPIKATPVTGIKDVINEKNVKQQNLNLNIGSLQNQLGIAVIFDAVICKPSADYSNPPKTY